MVTIQVALTRLLPALTLALTAALPAQQTAPAKTMLLLVEGSLDQVTVTKAWRKQTPFAAIAVAGSRQAAVRLIGADGRELAIVTFDLTTVIRDRTVLRPIVEGDQVREVGIHKLVKIPDLGARTARVEFVLVDKARTRTIGLVKRDKLDRLIANSQLPAAGPTVKTHQNNGPVNNRYDIVILAEGYRASELAKFHSDVSRWMKNLFGRQPFKRYRKFFNVHSVHNPSKQSGADHPDRQPPIVKDTIYNATYNYANTPRCVYIRNLSQALADAALAPDVEGRVVVFVNDSRYGGCASTFAVSYNGSLGPEVQTHEFGHSFAGLADEYDYGRTGTYTGRDPIEPNVTSISSCTKWALWKGSNGVGCYQGAKYYKKGLWRPKSDCLMRTLGRPLCPICVEKMTKDGYQTVNPIVNAAPTGSRLTLVRPASQVFKFTNLVPGGGQVRWFVDNSLKQTGGTSFTLATSQTSLGSHTVKLELTDKTALVRKDVRQRLVRTRLWTVSVSAASFVDLRPFILSTSSSSYSGKTLRLDTFVQNLGTGTSTASTVDFFLSKDANVTTADTWLGSAPVPPLRGSGFTNVIKTVQLPFFADKGTFYVGVWIDRKNLIRESNETNNKLTRSIGILGPQGCATRLEFDSPLQPLTTNTISAAAGGIAKMVLTAPCLKGNWYLVQWTCSGTSPGIKLPSGHVLPINFDSCTMFALSQINGPLMPAFFGLIDQNGHGRPAFGLPPGLKIAPFQSHFAAWFAAPSGQPFTGTTNAVGQNLAR